MKKPMLILFAAMLVLSLFAGCGRKKGTMPTTMPTQPLATVPSESIQESRPQPTIEDGNGPIPSQSGTPMIPDSTAETTSETVSETLSPTTSRK